MDEICAGYLCIQILRTVFCIQRGCSYFVIIDSLLEINPVGWLI